MNSNDFIAVFDSGVGGISVLKHLVRVLPNERYLYFGDSANAPYGTKTKEEVKTLTFAAANNLMDALPARLPELERFCCECVQALRPLLK